MSENISVEARRLERAQQVAEVASNEAFMLVQKIKNCGARIYQIAMI